MTALTPTSMVPAPIAVAHVDVAIAVASVVVLVALVITGWLIRRRICAKG
jgi:hypothetical protein